MQFKVFNRITWCSVLLLLFSTRPSQQESTEDVANAIEQLKDLIDSKFSNVESMITDINTKLSNVELALNKINTRLDYIGGDVVFAQVAAESTKALLEQHYNETNTTNEYILEDLHTLKEKEISIEEKFNNMDLRINESLETMDGKVTEIKTISKETNSMIEIMENTTTSIKDTTNEIKLLDNEIKTISKETKSMIKIMENTTTSIKATTNEIKELDNETKHLIRTLKNETKLLKYPLDEANRLGNKTLHGLHKLKHSNEMWRGSLEEDIKSVKEDARLCNSGIKSLMNETDEILQTIALTDNKRIDVDNDVSASLKKINDLFEDNVYLIFNPLVMPIFSGMTANLSCGVAGTFQSCRWEHNNHTYQVVNVQAGSYPKVLGTLHNQCGLTISATNSANGGNWTCKVITQSGRTLSATKTLTIKQFPNDYTYELFNYRELLLPTKSSKKKSYQASVGHCTSMGAVPFIPRSVSDFDFMVQVKKELGGYMWFPANDIDSEGHLKWTDNTDAGSGSPGFINWCGGAVLKMNKYDGYDCGIIGYGCKEAVSMYPCNIIWYPMICEIIG